MLQLLNALRSLTTLVARNLLLLLLLLVTRFYSRAYFRATQIANKKETLVFCNLCFILLDCDLHCAIAFLT